VNQGEKNALRTHDSLQ